jgi:2-polyprenyl-3-methyl-5-hydroxy-6-metoxy-1,4-benzoquinol methylase
MEMSQRPRCTVCEQEATRRDPFFYDWRGRRFWIYRCTRCTHQFVHPSVTHEDQALIYSNHYFSREGDWGCGIFQAGYIEAEPQLRKEGQEILAILPTRSGKLLDIGCAGGVFLDEARKWGFEVTGVELNRSMAEYAKITYHVSMLTGYIEDVSKHQWSGAFDVVTLLDCLEHIPQPLEAMRKVGHWLRPGGIVFIRGPLSNSLVARFKERLRRMLRIAKRLPGYPLDANMFNKRSLGTLLATSGFEITAWIGETASFSNLLARKKL